MNITKEERKIWYPLILFCPCIITFVIIISEKSATNDWIKWVVLGIIWAVSFGLIIWGEVEIYKKRKKNKRKRR